MAGPYFINDTGTGTNAAWSSGSNGDTWERAYTSWAHLLTNNTFASGEIIYVGADADITNIGASQVFTGPTSGQPVEIRSSTVSTGTTVAYSKGTGTQIAATGGAYDLDFDGAWALYGVKAVAGGDIYLKGDNNEVIVAEDCDFTINNIGTDTASSLGCWFARIYNCELILGDSTSITTPPINCQVGSGTVISGLTITNGSYRTAGLINNLGGSCRIVGIDASSCTNITGITQGSHQGHPQVLNCKFPAGIAGIVNTGNTYPNATGLMVVNCGPTDAPEYLFFYDYSGRAESTTSVYVTTGGAEVEGQKVSWNVTTTANSTFNSPFFTPWIYGVVSSVGTKTVTVHIANNTADLTTAQCWLEAEAMGTSDNPLYTLYSDRCTLAEYIAGTASATGRDEDIDWTGSPGTYEQKLSASVSVGETGIIRVRVAVAYPSLSNLYIDPKLTIT